MLGYFVLMPHTYCNAAMLCGVAARRIKVPRDLQLLISDMCSRLNVDGLRGDLVVNRAVKALVAYEGRTNVSRLAVLQSHCRAIAVSLWLHCIEQCTSPGVQLYCNCTALRGV
jgi:hypothetical protein